MRREEQIQDMDLDIIADDLYETGEKYFWSGEFQKAMDYFLRCIRAPKHDLYGKAEIQSYYLLGRIYSYLNQEILAKENLLHAMKMSRESENKRMCIRGYISLGILHEKAQDFEKALLYQEKAKKLIEIDEQVDLKLKMSCLLYRGMAYAKMEQIKESEACFLQIQENFSKEEKEKFCVAIWNLALYISLGKQDLFLFSYYFKLFLEYEIPKIGYFEILEHYFDSCFFLLKRERKEEVQAVLEKLKAEQEAGRMLMPYQKYRLYHIELLYAEKYEDESRHRNATKCLLEILPEYEAEVQKAKFYSFDYIEYIHAERSLSAKMEQKSKLDPMTGLLNKFTIESMVEEYFQRMDKSHTTALLLIDMDRFKEINDTLGHLTGDAVLIDTAMVIRRFFKEGALCGRVGGDEFIVFVKNVDDISSLMLQAEFLRQEIAKTTTKRGITISVRASVGIAVSKENLLDYESIFEAADAALYRAKKEGRNKICVL